MQIHSRIKVALGLAALAFSAGAAFAATQGTLGATSSGTLVISSTKGNAVQISNLSDLTFPSSSTVAPSPLSETPCVYSTTTNYTITATSANPGAGSIFQVTNGVSFITYRVDWADAAVGGTSRILSSGVISPTIGGANNSNPTCGGTYDSRLTITIDPSGTTWGPASTGTYTDTLTLLVAPI